jgi:hypothetical protein
MKGQLRDDEPDMKEAADGPHRQVRIQGEGKPAREGPVHWRSQHQTAAPSGLSKRGAEGEGQ